jgi:multicopper oxidase
MITRAKNAAMLISLICFATFALASPILIDLAVSGTQDNPSFTPNQLQFKEGQEYLLVVTNEQSYGVTFHYNKFGQSLLTHYLQGTSSVTQDSMMLLPHSKIFWHFVPLKKGEYVFHAANASLNQKGADGKIVIEAQEIVKKDNTSAKVDNKKEQKTKERLLKFKRQA